MGVRFELVTRAGCHLCDEMAAVLDDVLPGYGLAWSPRNVDAGPELRARVTDVVPVLLRGGLPVAKARLDPPSPIRIVRSPRAAGGGDVHATFSLLIRGLWG